MADPLTGSTGELEQSALQEGAAPASSSWSTKRAASMQRRFGIAYFLLAIAVGTAIGLLIVLAGRSDSGTSRSWSDWRPTGRGEEAAAQIARHVQERYRLPSGREPLAAIFVRPAAATSQSESVPISAIAVRTGYADELASDVEIVKTDGTVFFAFCGFGTACAITGTPTIARAQLLQQEILELSLYTLKYVKGVDAVVAYAPPSVVPASKQVVRTVALLQRSDWEKALGRPLAQTLPQQGPLVPASITPAERRLAGQVKLLQYQLQPLPDGTAALVVAPLSA